MHKNYRLEITPDIQEQINKWMNFKEKGIPIVFHNEPLSPDIEWTIEEGPMPARMTIIDIIITMSDEKYGIKTYYYICKYTLNVSRYFEKYDCIRTEYILGDNTYMISEIDDKQVTLSCHDKDIRPLIGIPYKYASNFQCVVK